MARIIGKTKSAPFEEPAVNLTPLIDVVFVILIGFIIIAPLLEVDKVELAEAPHNGPRQSLSVQETSPISIHVRQDNSILIKGTAVAPQDLEEKLQILKKQYPQAVPQLFHDKKAHFGTYQTVKNALEASGFEQLDIVLNP
jgi:biopolymer transport protein ExbD